MQAELEQAYPLLQIQLLGVNERGQEPGNSTATTDHDIPWLQDVDADDNGNSDVWRDLWDVTYRDIIILDGENVPVAVYNATQHDLADAENYSTFRELLVDAAMDNQKPWHNSAAPEDVDRSDFVSARDVLYVINRLNAEGAGKLAPPTGTVLEPPFFDVNGDGNVTPSDALRVINFINAALAPAEAEGEPSALPFQTRELDDTPSPTRGDAPETNVTAPVSMVSPEIPLQDELPSLGTSAPFADAETDWLLPLSELDNIGPREQ